MKEKSRIFNFQRHEGGGRSDTCCRTEMNRIEGRCQIRQIRFHTYVHDTWIHIAESSKSVNNNKMSSTLNSHQQTFELLFLFYQNRSLNIVHLHESLSSCLANSEFWFNVSVICQLIFFFFCIISFTWTTILWRLSPA